MPKSKKSQSKRKSDQSINQPVTADQSTNDSNADQIAGSTASRTVQLVASTSIDDDISFECAMALNFPFDSVPLSQVTNQSIDPSVTDGTTLYLKTILRHVRKRLYIQLAHVEFDKLHVSVVQKRLADLYAIAYQVKPDVDVVITFPMINQSINQSVEQLTKMLSFIAEYPTNYSNSHSNNQSSDQSIKLFHRVAIPAEVDYLFTCDFKTQAQPYSQQMSNQPKKPSSDSPKKRRTRADIEAEEAATAARLTELINHTRVIGGIVVPAISSSEGSSHKSFYSPSIHQSVNQPVSSNHSHDASDIMPPLFGVLFDPSIQSFALGPPYQIDWTASMDPVDGLVHPVSSSSYHSSSQSAAESTSHSTASATRPAVIQAGDQSINTIDSNFGQFSHVVLGGTFDHLHLGHKLLLSTGAFVARQSFLIGVTSQSMLTRKTLGDLIEAPEVRLAHVKQFVQAVRPDLAYEIMVIDTPAGPTLSNVESSTRLDCMIASDETLSSAASISKQRQEMSPPLQPFALVNLSVFNMPPAQSVNQSEEQSANAAIASMIGLDKLSSTGKRFEMIGKYLGRTNRYPWTHTVRVGQSTSQSSNQSTRPYQCYVIGLTGGIASGKSNIANNLKQCGAHVIDCDLVGHACYKQGEPAYQAIIERFGREVVSENGEINRPKLGSIVFADPNDKSALNDLNMIVWPAIQQRVVAQLSTLSADTIAVVEAAVMLEAGWGAICDELWIAFVPQTDAVSRIQERNNLSAAEAARRVASQMDNASRLAHADVILTSIFEKSVTEQVCELAWSSLLERVAYRQQNQAGMSAQERFEHAINTFFRVPAKAKIIELDAIEQKTNESESTNPSTSQSMEQSDDEKADESATPSKRRKKSNLGVLSAQSILHRWWPLLPATSPVTNVRDSMFHRLDERAPDAQHVVDLVLATLFWNAKIGTVADATSSSSVKQEVTNSSMLNHSELLDSVQMFGAFASQLRLTNAEMQRIIELILLAAPAHRPSRHVRPAAATIDQAIFIDMLQSAGAL